MYEQNFQWFRESVHRGKVACSLVFGMLLLVGCATTEKKSAVSSEYLEEKPYEIAGLPQQEFTYDVNYEKGELMRLFFEGTQGYIYKPKGKIDPKRRWIWVVPLWLPLKAGYGVEGVISRYYMEAALEEGFHVVGIDVGTSLGSPAGAELFQKFYEMVVDEFNLNKKARMFATSNGGLITYGWAFRHPEHVDRIFGVYPATDFRTWPGLEKVCGPGSIAPEGLAYNLSLEEMQQRISEFNPIDNLEPLARHDVKIFHIHGNKDDVVPLEPNSLELMRRYRELGGEAEVQILDGEKHGGMVFFESERAVEFMLD